MATENKNEKKTPEQPKKVTIASLFRELAVKPSKDRAELADKILAQLKAKGMDKNVRGFEIKKERVTQQVSAMIRDINIERGKDKNSWWSQYTVTEEPNVLKIVLKKA